MSDDINVTVTDSETINVSFESGVGQDTKTIKVSSNDTTDDYLENKIISGEGITITKNDSGSNESLEISSSNPTIEWGEILGDISDQTDLQNALDLKATIVDLNSHINDLTNPHEVTKTQVGLSNVDNTSDLDKPISDATQSTLDLKYNSVDFNNDFDSRLSVKDTDNLSEGSNLYYTEARVSANTDVSANTSARHIAVTVTDSSEIDFTLNGQDITASLIGGSIDETKLDTSVNSSLDLADSALQNITGESIANLSDVDSITGIVNGKILKWDTNKFVVGDDNDTTYTASNFNHDDLSNIPVKEHIDWTTSQAPIVIHADNYTNTTYTSSDFNLSDHADVDDTDKAENKILKVDSEGNHIYVVDESGTDEKLKYDAGDPIAGYVADKIIAGSGISVAEGTGADENKLVVTNDDKGSDVDLSSYVPYSGATTDVNILEHDLNVGGIETLVDFSTGATFMNALTTAIMLSDPYKVVPDDVPVFDVDYNSSYYLTFTDGALSGQKFQIYKTIEEYGLIRYNALYLDGYSGGATSGDGFIIEFEHHQSITLLGNISATNVSGTNTGDRNNRQLTVSIDGGSSAPVADTITYVRMPYSGTITGWHIASDVSGSCVIDVWKDTFGNFPPTVADTIAGTEKPTLSSTQTASDTNLTTWTTDVSAGDWIAINVDSASILTKIWLAISIEASD